MMELLVTVHVRYYVLYIDSRIKSGIAECAPRADTQSVCIIHIAVDEISTDIVYSMVSR